MTLLALLLGASGPLWIDLEHDARIAFPPGWTVSDGGEVFKGQVASASRGTIHVAVRFEAVEEVIKAPRRVLDRLVDPDAWLGPERHAESLMLAQTDGSTARTLYIGFSDTEGPRVGRWVFFEPASRKRVEHVWWHATWRTATHFGQLVGWDTREHVAELFAAMRELEAGLGSASGYRAESRLAWADKSRGCESTDQVDRARSIRESEAHAALAAEAATWDVEPRLRELDGIAELVATVNHCVELEAGRSNLCAVAEVEGGPRSPFEERVTACLDSAR